jgi:hypothetical protein
LLGQHLVLSFARKAKILAGGVINIGRVSVERIEAVEVLGRLCAGAVDMSRGGGRSSANVLQRAEIAGYLQGLGTGPLLVGLAKYMGDEQAADHLVALQFRFLVSCSLLWPCGVVQKLDMARKIAEVSVSEFVFNRCDWRKGVDLKPEKTPKNCLPPVLKRVSGRQIASALHLSEATFRRVWRDRYYASTEKLQIYDQCISRALARMHWQEIIETA